MTKRLQVLLPEPEMHRLRRLSKTSGVTVAEWVRGAIRKAALAQAEAGPELKIKAIRSAISHSFPTADIEKMLSDIERGRHRMVTH